MPTTPFCCASCNGCKNSSPTGTLKVTISGVNMQVGVCKQAGSGSTVSFHKVISGDVNGTYCLTSFDNGNHSCAWKVTLPTPIVIDSWVSSGGLFGHVATGCGDSGALYTRDTITELVVIVFDDGTLIILCTGVASLSASLKIACAFIFRQVLDPNCVDGTYDNAVDSSTGTAVLVDEPYTYVGPPYGGSAVLQFGGC